VKVAERPIHRPNGNADFNRALAQYPMTAAGESSKVGPASGTTDFPPTEALRTPFSAAWHTS